MSNIEGWTQTEPVTQKMSDICIEVQPSIEDMAKKSFAIYNPITYRMKNTGTDYVVKVDTGDGVCVHAMLYQGLPQSGGAVAVNEIQYPKNLSDPLVPF